jgi:hypothetical protein
MKLRNAHYFIPLLQAAAQGKTLQCQSSSGEWWDVTENTEMGFTGDPITWRIKPEQTLRPWKPEEVPVGAVVKMTSQRCLIIAVNCNDKVVMADSTKNEVYGYPIDMLIGSAYSLDHGKTWLPCGVLE